MVGRTVQRKPGTLASAHERLHPIGIIRSILKTRREAPKQGREGAPDAWLEVRPALAQGLNGIAVGDEIVILTWLHQAHRDVLKVRPRADNRRPPTGVFATRSPDRPNPVGLHPVTVKRIVGNRLRIGPIEAIDRTPVIDIKPVLCKGANDARCRVDIARRRVSDRAATIER